MAAASAAVRAKTDGDPMCCSLAGRDHAAPVDRPGAPHTAPSECGKEEGVVFNGTWLTTMRNAGEGDHARIANAARSPA
jgi:hypothetical protein